MAELHFAWVVSFVYNQLCNDLHEAPHQWCTYLPCCSSAGSSSICVYQALYRNTRGTLLDNHPLLTPTGRTRPP